MTNTQRMAAVGVAGAAFWAGWITANSRPEWTISHEGGELVIESNVHTGEAYYLRRDASGVLVWIQVQGPPPFGASAEAKIKATLLGR